jgi:hypothetical protein
MRWTLPTEINPQALRYAHDLRRPLASLSVDSDGPLYPGSTIQVDWSVSALSSPGSTAIPWREATASILYAGTQVYGSAPQHASGPVFSVGESGIGITPPSAVAGDFYRIGDHRLDLVTRGDAATPSDLTDVATFTIAPLPVSSALFDWSDTNPSDRPWNSSYSLSGDLTNPGPALLHATVSLLEWTSDYQANPTERQPFRPFGGQVERQRLTLDVPHESTVPITFDPIQKSWTWLTPVGVVIDATGHTFQYALQITLADEFGNPSYPTFFSTFWNVAVIVSSPKLAAAITCQVASVTAVALTLTAIAAAAGIFTAAVGAVLGIAAGAAAATAATAFICAIDPPVADPNFRTKVREPRLRKLRPAPGLDSLVQLLGTVEAILLFDRAQSQAESKLLGAASAGDLKAAKEHQASQRHFSRQMVRHAQKLPDLASRAYRELANVWSVEDAKRALDLWRSGLSEEILATLAKRGLSEKAFREVDAARAVPMIADAAIRGPDLNVLAAAVGEYAVRTDFETRQRIPTLIKQIPRGSRSRI